MGGGGLRYVLFMSYDKFRGVGDLGKKEGRSGQKNFYQPINRVENVSTFRTVLKT